MVATRAHRTAASTSASDAGRRPATSRSSVAGIHQFQRPEQAHRRGHEQRPDDGRVEGHGDRHADPERLDEHDVGEGERAGDDDHDERRRGHDPAAPLQAAGDGLRLSPVRSQTSFIRDSRKTS